MESYQKKKQKYPVFMGEYLEDRGNLSLNGLKLLPPADNDKLCEACKLKEDIDPTNRLNPELLDETIYWASK